MARMTFDGVRVAMGADGVISLPKAEGQVVGKVTRHGRKWAAAVADEDGKIAAKRSEHPTRQAAFEHVLQERGIVNSPEAG